MALPDGFDLDEFATRVLAEDLGQGGDVTSAATIAADARFTAEMNARQALVVAGVEVAAAFFKALDSEVRVELLAKDGDSVERGTTLMRLAGNARAMLAAERPALNTLQHLSGVATRGDVDRSNGPSRRRSPTDPAEAGSVSGRRRRRGGPDRGSGPLNE